MYIISETARLLPRLQTENCNKVGRETEQALRSKPTTDGRTSLGSLLFILVCAAILPAEHAVVEFLAST